MITAGIVWLSIGVAMVVILIASGSRRTLRQITISFLVLVAAAVLIGGGYAFLAWRDGVLHVGSFDRLFGPR